MDALPQPATVAAVTSALVMALLVCDGLHRRGGVWLFKPLASLGFVATAVANGAWTTLFGQMVLVALALSLVGDVLLIPKDKRSFLAGLVAFLLGHVAFAAAFVVRGTSGLWVALAMGVLAPVGILVGAWLLPSVEARMQLPVKAYMVVITLMVALAAGSVVHLGGWILLGAAVCFFGSDLAVARDRFVAPGFANRAWGIPLYYVAQLMFALGVHA